MISLSFILNYCRFQVEYFESYKNSQWRGRFGQWCFNTIFNNISVRSWWSLLLVEETRVPRENHQPAASHGQISSHNAVLITPRLSGIQTHNISGDKHWLYRYLETQLLYNHGHNGPHSILCILHSFFSEDYILLHYTLAFLTKIYIC